MEEKAMNEKYTNKSLTERLFSNNRFLVAFCIIISVILWATVKINYSDDTVRTISDIKVSLTAAEEELDYTAFILEEDLLVDVEVRGKAYNINARALSRDDIIVEAVSSFVDSAGYKVVSLNAKISDTAAANDFEITSISPSTITVFFDREVTETFNVVARIKNGSDKIVKDGFLLGKAIPSLNTVNVTGPATILAEMENVYFDATIDNSMLPLTSAAEIPAELVYPVTRPNDSRFLVCPTINNDVNPATVTLPVYATKPVPLTLKFINKPEGIKEPDYTISPSQVKIIYNPKDEEKYGELNVGTIDFKKLDNTKNKLNIVVNQEDLAIRLSDKKSISCDIVVDMSGYTKTNVSYSAANVMFLNRQEDMVYSLGTGGLLDNITVIGPASSVEKLTSDDIRIEINVSALNMSRSNSQVLEANITIGNSEITDCWVYGEYKAVVTRMTEEEAAALATQISTTAQ